MSEEKEPQNQITLQIKFYKCRSCGNKTDFFETGDYTTQIICSKTGEELNIQPVEYHEHYISCGKCGSADVEITTVEMKLWSNNNKKIPSKNV